MQKNYLDNYNSFDPTTLHDAVWIIVNIKSVKRECTAYVIPHSWCVSYNNPTTEDGSLYIFRIITALFVKEELVVVRNLNLQFLEIPTVYILLSEF